MSSHSRNLHHQGHNTCCVISINEREHLLSGLEDLQHQLELLRQREYADTILTRGDEGTFLLTNRRLGRAFLMFLTDANPVGFHAISTDQFERADDFPEFILSNGQEDEHPVGDTVPLADGLSALEHFFVNGGMAPFIQWHDDALGSV